MVREGREGVGRYKAGALVTYLPAIFTLAGTTSTFNSHLMIWLCIVLRRRKSWSMWWWSKVKPLHNSLTPDYTSVAWVCSHMIWRIHHWPTVLQVLLLLLLHHRCCFAAKTEKELDGDTCSDEYLDCRWKPRPLLTFLLLLCFCCCYGFYRTRTLLCRLRRSACKGENTLQVFWHNSNNSV